jgi:heme A synthase
MDPGTSITTWQQAFEEYRVPTTRAIEKQLKSSATRDKEKLRVLVGWVNIPSLLVHVQYLELALLGVTRSQCHLDS